VWHPGEGGAGRFEVRAFVDGELAAESTLLVSVLPG
jgi:3-hydroxymyristoyl/3-hydroxydecanoyl-(acyl carrier protein) dehydratase